MTRQFRPEQMELGEVPSEDIYINPRSRDDVPKILRGIRSLVSNPEFRSGLEMLIATGFLPGSDSGQGRPGIDLWRIFVLGVLKQGLGCDFGRLMHHANHDTLARQFLGHADFIDRNEYRRQTLVGNIRHSRRSYRQDLRAGREARPRNRGKEARGAGARQWRLVRGGARQSPGCVPSFGVNTLVTVSWTFRSPIQITPHYGTLLNVIRQHPNYILCQYFNISCNLFVDNFVNFIV